LSVLGSQGEAGQFRTPRHIIDFMVAVIDPKKTETVLDPASGTGGFLVEAFNHHLGAQVKTVADRAVLQERSLSGCEPKPLPSLFCQMNLLLHGLDAPQIDPGNALRHRLSEIGEKERVDVIVTNLTGAYSYWAHVGRDGAALSDVVDSGRRVVVSLRSVF